jgi:hypothetical protein
MYRKVIILLLVVTVSQFVGADTSVDTVDVNLNHTEVSHSNETHKVIISNEPAFGPAEDTKGDKTKKPEPPKPSPSPHSKETKKPEPSIVPVPPHSKETKKPEPSKSTPSHSKETKKPEPSIVPVPPHSKETKKPSPPVQSSSAKVKGSTSRNAPLTTPAHFPSFKPHSVNPLHGERAKIEGYLTDMFLFENTLLRDTKVGTFWEIFHGRGLNYDDYIFHSALGSIVEAGPKTRAYHLPGHKCGGLKKLYQYFNHTDQTTRLTLNFRDTNNKGDRQPIGLCGRYKGQCGADLPLYVYFGTHRVSNNPHKPAYFYSTNPDYTFLYDRKNYTLVSKDPLCYIYSRSDNRTQYDKATEIDQNLHVRNLFSEIVPVYEFSSENDTFYDINAYWNSTDLIRHAFNLFKNDTYLIQRCHLRPVVDFLFILNSNITITGSDRVVTGKKDVDEVSKLSNITVDSTTYLGFGMNSQECGAYIRYEVYQFSKNESFKIESTYVARAGQKRHEDDKQFMEGYFYSL